MPIVRIIDDTLSTMMSEYAVYAVLGFIGLCRNSNQPEQQDLEKRWPNFTPDTHIGVLGIGAMARTLRISCAD